MRECSSCAGTDDALLSRKLSNERTILLAAWFHCVKLPNHVLRGGGLRGGHPWSALFESSPRAHVLLASYDGTTLVPLSGSHRQSALWRGMYKLLHLAYRGGAKRVVAERLELLARFDAIDAKILPLVEEADRVLYAEGKGSRKYASLTRRVRRLEKERERFLARERTLVELGLRRDPREAKKSDLLGVLRKKKESGR